MKSKQQILNRLKKLYLRYLNKHVNLTQKRICYNCKYCENHTVGSFQYDKELPTQFELFPTHVSSVILIDQKPESIELCMYGSNNPSEWQGTICNDEISLSCKLFSPCLSIEEAKLEFEELIGDDKYVLKYYPDIAILQWILNDRIIQYLSWWDKFWIWIKLQFIKPDPILEESPLPEIPKDFWNDSV